MDKALSINNLQRRAMQCSRDGLFLEAQDLFEDCMKQLQPLIQSEKNAGKRNNLQQCQNNCDQQIKNIKKETQRYIERAKRVEYITIAQNSTGHSYEQLFGKYLDNTTREVFLRETYIYKNYQFQNLIRFLELLVTNCPNLHYIRVITTKGKLQDNAEHQDTYLGQIKRDMQQRNIRMTIKFDNLHDRHIILNNNYIYNIVIQRGLDIYHPPQPRYSIGLVDYRYRKCKESSVSICRSKTSANGESCSIM